MGSSRLTGVDVARALALIGMFATHTMPLVDSSTGTPTATWVAYLFAGKASALFATLAGVGLALLTARTWAQRTKKSRSRSAAPTMGAQRRGIAARAAFIMVLGFLAAEFSSGIAVILVHYAVLFLFALALIQATVKQLLWLGVGWLALSPVVLFFVRAWAYANVAPYRTSGPVFMDFLRPQTLLADLFATGYYPLIVWPVYLIAGLLVGRLLHTSSNVWAVSWRITRWGFAMTFVAYAISWRLINANWSSLVGVANTSSDELRAALISGQGLSDFQYSPWWFMLSAPHSGTQLDLLLTVGTSLAVLGLCLMLCKALEGALKFVGQALTWPLAGAGSATLTLYVGHIIALDLFSSELATLEPLHRWLIFTVVALLFGVFISWKQVRGPLEWINHSIAAHASGQPHPSGPRASS
ncbi:heparan-alpha-glucosaminide N-acetyltransferase domain-containing protein [Neomicrococcus aestuarii]|uniref:Heparan-alpha-glucosaminide N-acetyltransferase catalytic domain-containing protein n=1 Tax=Neomicrococcus aestuarii TaxID=556325 RepID=A0A1L2ZMG3_9MICC|nr:heparan-alpha-glucosaminide N-acetyltransferase domain-containing protein [Neomicrococcus aestuarii]APF40319.1 hypothetical protein BHE16_04015 [Neomicrococcus aestuarii]